jgi:hypothetical protein
MALAAALILTLLHHGISPNLLIGCFLKSGRLIVYDAGHQSHISRKLLWMFALPECGSGRLNMLLSISQSLLKPPGPPD